MSAPVLDALGIGPEVQEFFLPFIAGISEEQLCVNYTDRPGAFTPELSGWDPGQVPSAQGIWSAGTAYPPLVRHLFVFHSAIEAICFCQAHPAWLSRSVNCVFAALGLLPCREQVRLLCSRFPSAKFHLIFGSDLPGRVTDCKAALWARSEDAFFLMEDGLIKTEYHGKQIAIPEPAFSLHAFRKASGLRGTIRTYKPKGGFASFYDLVKTQALKS